MMSVAGGVLIGEEFMGYISTGTDECPSFAGYLDEPGVEGRHALSNLQGKLRGEYTPVSWPMNGLVTYLPFMISEFFEDVPTRVT